MRSPALRLALLMLLALPAACTPEPRPIRYGEDTCAHCIMTVSDARYGAELVTTTGKTYVFDSIECLAGYLLQERDGTDRIHSLWVTDFEQPGTLIPAEDAVFLHSPALRSPMGMNLTAFAPTADPARLRAEHGGEILTWDDVLALVQTRQAAGGHAHTRPR